MLGSDLDSLFSLEQVYLTSLSFSFLLYTAGRIKSDGVENKTQSNKNLRTGHSASKLSDYHPDHSYSECYTASNTALSNYYCLLLSTKVLYFVDITIFCHQLQLLLHLVPSFLCQSPVWRGYSHQKENMDDALHSPVPKILQQCAWQRNLGPRVHPPPGNFWRLPFTIFHHCPECQPSGQFPLREPQPCKALNFSTSQLIPSLPTIPSVTGQCHILDKLPATSWICSRSSF